MRSAAACRSTSASCREKGEYIYGSGDDALNWAWKTVSSAAKSVIDLDMNLAIDVSTRVGKTSPYARDAILFGWGFYADTAHELAEIESVGSGLPREIAHRLVLEQQGNVEYDLYHPDVIKALPEWFNSFVLSNTRRTNSVWRSVT